MLETNTLRAKFAAAYEAWNPDEEFAGQWQAVYSACANMDAAEKGIREHGKWSIEFGQQAHRAATQLKSLVGTLDTRVAELQDRLTTQEEKAAEDMVAQGWKTMHLTHRMNSPSGQIQAKTAYAVDIAWRVEQPGVEKVVTNPDHPYWQGRKFAQWLKQGKHLTTHGNVWYEAEQDPSHPLYLGGSQEIPAHSWFQGINDELAGKQPPKLSAEELRLIPVDMRYAQLFAEQHL